MNEFEQLQQQITQINNRKIQLQTLVDQAKKRCLEIQQKYNVSSEAELLQLLTEAHLKKQKLVEEAQKYIQENNEILSQYSGII